MNESEPAKWHERQVQLFNDSRGNHAEIARVLLSVLTEIKRRTDPTAMIQVRPKSLASFSEKAIRKKGKYNNPVEQLTDVVGGRIITYTEAAAEKVRSQIEELDRKKEKKEKKELLIDWDNSLDTAIRLKPEEFGYKAMHYIVQLQPPNVLGVEVPSWLARHKVEIQVCTLMQHVWAAIGHDRIYKTTLTISDALKRQLSAISALLETAQADFERGITALDRYIEGFAPELDKDKQKEEEMKWQSVIKVEPYSSDARRKLAQHYASLGHWQHAYDQLLECDADLPYVLAKRGRAAAKLGLRKDAEDLFAAAIEKDASDWEARCDLADLLAKHGKHKAAGEQYQKAFEVAPTEPRVLVEHVASMISHEGNLACTRALHGALDAAIQECHKRAQMRVDLPNAFLRAGRCFLFQGGDAVYSALDAYCKASLASDSIDSIETERQIVAKMLQRLTAQRAEPAELEPYDCVAKLLQLLTVAVSRRLRNATTGKMPDDAVLPKEEEIQRLRSLATQTRRPDFKHRPVVIIAGGCDPNVEERMKTYGDTMECALKHFEGTLICGGTTAGISGMIGRLSKKRKSAIHAIGYLPPELPNSDVRDDDNYRIYDVPDKFPRYSSRGPIQTWADLLLAKVEPATVRLLGINGGKLSGFEFRLAMAMGATVGLVEDSGRAVSTLLTDPDWRRLGRLTALFNEAATISPFISIYCSSFSAFKTPEERQKTLEALARAQHEHYRKGKISAKGYVHPSMVPWNKGLSESYKDSNRQQAVYMDQILRTEGFAMVASNDPRPAVNLNDPKHQEALGRMAQLEHGRFNAERLADGWQYGAERDLEKKTNPNLVPWNKLSEKVQGWDFDPFRLLHKLLRPLKLKVVQIKSIAASTKKSRRKKTKNSPTRKKRRSQ